MKHGSSQPRLGNPTEVLDVIGHEEHISPTVGRKEAHMLRHTRSHRTAALLWAVLFLAACADGTTSETTGEVEESIAMFATDAVPACSSLPQDVPLEDAEFSENELVDLLNRTFPNIDRESGIDSGGVGSAGRVELSFIDPSTEALNAVVAELPDGFCIGSVQFTPEPPDSLDIFSESGDVSSLPSGVEPVAVFFAPEAGRPDADSNEITLWLLERECASGQEMGDRLVGPEVFESESEILIAAGVAIQLTEQDCPSNPPTVLTVTLDSPVGDRTIRDAVTGQEVRVSDGDF